VKNTAIGSHAGPVGSITTSSRVPAAAPDSAAASTPARLSAVGRARRRQTSPPWPSSTLTVWSLAMPRSIPTRRLFSPISLLLIADVEPEPPGRRDGPRKHHLVTVPPAAPTGGSR
jgi:hypothetical protein